MDKSLNRKKLLQYPLLIVVSIMSTVTTSCDHNSKSLSINFTGDIILARGVEDELSIHSDSLLFNSLRLWLDGDYNVINLETVLTEHADVNRSGYSFRNEPDIAKYLKIGGVSHASLANNHSGDFGIEGYLNTQSALTSHNISPFGMGCEPIQLSNGENKGTILAVSLTTNNDHLCIKDSASLIGYVEQFRLSNKKTPLIVYIHWGLEYQLRPEKWQQELAYRLIDRGADAIIGHHPHVFQSFELYKQKPIVYSLGNFVADAYLPNTTTGVMAQVKIDSDSLEVGLIPIDLSSYFPAKMSEKNEVKMLISNLKYSQGMCVYKSDNQWFMKGIDEVDFQEEASDWIFHYNNQYDVLVSKLSNGQLKLALTIGGVPRKPMLIHGDLSEIEFADVTNDGRIEMLLGITKKVNFDQRNRKRINVFRVEDESLQVVWLGTKFLNDILSFEVVNKGHFSYLQTLEIDSNETQYSRQYEWDQFGFALNNQLQ